MLKLPKIKPYWIELLFIFVVGLVPLLWFKGETLAAGHDMSYPLAPIDFWIDRLYTWTDRVGSFGSNQTEAIPGLFMHGLQALFYALTGSLQLAQKLDFAFWLVLPGLTMYILLKSLHPENESFVLRISGALFYMVNHYLLQAWVIAEMSKFSIVSALPLVILGIINVVLKGGSIFKNAFLIGVTLFFLNGGAGIPLWGGLVIASSTALIISVFISPDSWFKKVRRALAFSFLTLLFVLLTNLYWIYPYLASYKYNYTHRLGAAGGSEGATLWSQEISKNASFTNLIKLQGIPDWYDNPSHPYSNTLLSNYAFIALALVFPILAFASLLSNTNQTRQSISYTVIFLAILLVAMPFTAGSHPPTGVLYNLALKYLPGFAIFRTPFYKFGMALWLAYAYLIGVGIKRLVDLVKQKWAKISLTGVSVAALAGYILLWSINNYPIFTGIFFNWSDKYSTQVAVPDYIFDAKDELDSNIFSTRTLMLPQLYSGNKYIAYDWKYFSLSSIPSMLSRRPVLLNDAVLNGNESGLTNAVYQQLEKTGKSSLLKYTGVDKVLVQEDFTADENMDYIINNKYASLLSSVSEYKGSGRWKFFNIQNPGMIPLVYIPNNFSYVIAETSHLSLVNQTPELPALGEALIFKHVSKGSALEPLIEDQKVQNITIQSQCLNCDEKKRVDVIRSSPPPISPSNPFYFLIELIDRRKMSKYKQNTEKVDFLLGTMSKEVTAMDTIVVNPKNDHTTKYLLQKWAGNVNSISSHFKEISGIDQQQEYARRIYYYYWDLLVSIQKWREGELPENTQSELTKFEELLSQKVQELNIPVDFSAFEYDVHNRVYSINAPSSGLYKLAVYNYKPNDQTSLLGSVNDQSYVVTKSPADKNWYFGNPIKLEEGGQMIVMPELTRRERSHPGFKLNVASHSSQCESVDLGPVDSRLEYDLSLDYLTLSDRLVKIDLLEANERFPEGLEKSIYPQTDKGSLDPFSYKVSVKYRPGSYAEKLFLKVCVKGGQDLSTAFELKGVNVIEKYPNYLVFLIKENPQVAKMDYNLEFTALNQTAYLVRVKKVKGRFILGFNSRLDEQWGIREVDPVAAAKYFIGQERKYLEGRVTEYERQDRHILSDLDFKGQVGKSPDLELNAYANGWSIDATDKEEMVFLIEFKPQNTLYKTSLLSALTLVILTFIYVLSLFKLKK